MSLGDSAKRLWMYLPHAKKPLGEVETPLDHAESSSVTLRIMPDMPALPAPTASAATKNESWRRGPSATGPAPQGVCLLGPPAARVPSGGRAVRGQPRGGKTEKGTRER